MLLVKGNSLGPGIVNISVPMSETMRNDLDAYAKSIGVRSRAAAAARIIADQIGYDLDAELDARSVAEREAKRRAAALRWGKTAVSSAQGVDEAIGRVTAAAQGRKTGKAPKGDTSRGKRIVEPAPVRA